MRKGKIIGILTSLTGVTALILTMLSYPVQRLSNTEVLLFVTSLILMMGGVSIYQFQNSTKKRRRFTYISFILVVIVILVGFLLKYLRLPAAGVLSIFGSFYLSFAVIPVIAKNRQEKWKNFTNSMFQIIGLMLFDSLGLVFLLLSVLFKLQHWPGATNLLISGIILVIAALLLWNKKFEKMFSFQIEAQAKLEEQHKEITDSINYAKRIQSAILPPNKIVKEYLEDSFILYKPKDVVAGDFYWMEHSEGKVFFAAADCTGHGVPGAMVSVVCNNALNRSVREYGMNTPGDILDKTKELVIKEFEKSEDEVKDGMDIALCCLEGNKLTYSGANNPLWIVRSQEIIEIKADKQPIGKFEFEKPFTTHEMDLIKGDSLYIFSDGYPDQFGGEKGKKYKTGNLKKLLLSIQNHPMEKQRNLLNDEFEKWRGSIEQIDDVCVIGVRI